LLGGVEVLGVADAPLLVPLARERSLADAVVELGGTLAVTGNPLWPAAQIGTVSPPADATSWQLTWQGWRGGVVSRHDARRLSDDAANPLAAAELFAWHAKDHPMAGRRTAGLSLWNPGADWLAPDESEPALSYLRASLWLIGLGNLGQAFAWLLACLPYADPSKVELTLQDYDLIADSNDSTSLLSSLPLVGTKKTRVVSGCLEAAGFKTALEEPLRTLDAARSATIRRLPSAASTTRRHAPISAA
jgi:hypothetical protein